MAIKTFWFSVSVRLASVANANSLLALILAGNRDMFRL